MDKGQAVEKLFSENLDLLLAGKEARIDSLDEELQLNLNFSRKMINLRVSPSPAFQAGLKASLMQKLADMDARKEASRQGWFWRLTSQKPVWQAAALALIVLIFAGVLWATGIFNNYKSTVQIPSTTAAYTTTTQSTTAVTTTKTTTATSKPMTTTTTSAQPVIMVSALASTDKTSYLPGEPVKISVTLQNLGSDTMKMDKFPPILSLMQNETRQPVYTFGYGNNSTTLSPNGVASYTVIWDQQDSQGKPVPAGIYYVELEDLDYQGQTVKLTLSQPVWFNITG
jgi:cytoskeletal protein RodZ